MSEGQTPRFVPAPQPEKKLLSEQPLWQLHQDHQLKLVKERFGDGGHILARVSKAERVFEVENGKGALMDVANSTPCGQDEDCTMTGGDLKRVIGDKRTHHNMKVDTHGKAPGGTGGRTQTSRKKTSSQKKNKTGSVESLFRRPGQTKSGGLDLKGRIWFRLILILILARCWFSHILSIC